MVYPLTAADALAYLTLKREPSGRAKVAMALWFLAGGAASGLLPERLMGPEGSWQAVATFLGVMVLQFGLLLAARALWRRWIARRMVPRCAASPCVPSAPSTSSACAVTSELGSSVTLPKSQNGIL